MPHPVQNEPTWLQVPGRIPPQYTRPLLCAEICHDIADRLDDGLGRCCMGVIFKTTLSNEELEHRCHESIGRARFFIPILACSITPDPKDLFSSSFVYESLGDKDELQTWINDSLTIRHEKVDSDAFIAEMTLTHIPFKHSNGREQPTHIYLIIGPDGVNGLFIYGPHTLMDARPALRCLDTLLGWIANPPSEKLDELPWGTEWQSLPAPPIAATGGIRDDWDTSGVEVMREIGEILQNQVPSQSLHPGRTGISNPGKMIHINESFDPEISSRITKTTKALGFTPSALFDAAVVLATFATNPVKPEDTEKAHITLDPTVIAQDRYLVPPHNGISHFVAGLTLVPLHVPYSRIDFSGNTREALISAMSIIKEQLDHFLANPNLPHVFPAQLAYFPPRLAKDISNPHVSVTSNMGNVSLVLRSKTAEDSQGSGPPIIEVQDMVFGHRLTWQRIMLHCWSFNSKMILKLQAADVWDFEDMQKYIRFIKEIMMSVLEN
ncbi:hypothetical protein ACEPAH_3979 [Sanghuangporus vaninii]